MGHGAPHIVGNQVDDGAGRGGKAEDAQVQVHEDRADARARQQVVHVVAGPGQIHHLGLQLPVDGGQLLVHRLQLFLGGLQLLVGGLQLLVHRLHLLVGGLELLVGGLQLLIGRLEVLLLDAQLLFERRDVPPGERSWIRGSWRWLGSGQDRGASLLQDDQEEVCLQGSWSQLAPSARQGMDAQVDPREVTIGPDLKAGAAHRLAGPCGRVESCDQLAAQALPSHLQDVGEADLAGGQLQEGPRAAVQVQDVALAVDEGTRRGGLLQEGVLRQVAQLVSHGVGRLAGCLGQGGVDRRHGGAEGAEGRPSAAAGVLLALVELGLAIHHAKEVRMLAHGLRGAQEEHATGVQGVVEQREQLLLQVAAQVDHEVPAADEIEPGEGRILDHVLLGKDHRVPDALVDPVAPAAGLGHEKPGQPFR